MGKKEFAIAALDPEYETFVVYVTSLIFTPLDSDVYPSYKTQISSFIMEEAPTKISDKYINFTDIFSLDLAFECLKHTRINVYAIGLVNGQQPPFESIYSLGSVELETLKAYIETNLANGFIRLSKSSMGAPILFDRKLNRSFQLYVNYRGFNNLTIKNWYLLLLIKKSLDRLGKTRQFTQRNLTSAYYGIRICKRDKWKTVFKTWYSHFEYQVMSFRLTNIPASF